MQKTYPLFGKLIHWAMAILILGMLCFGYWMTDLPKGPYKYQLIYPLHKSTGMLILLLIFIRFFYRIAHGYPPVTSNLNSLHELGIKLNIFLLYTFMFVMPLSGYFMSAFSGKPLVIYNLITVPPLFSSHKSLSMIARDIHEITAIGLIISISLHMLGNLFHYFILKDESFEKMWFFNRG